MFYQLPATGTKWTFRLKDDGTSLVIESTANGSLLYQEGPWKAEGGTLYYNMESQHLSSPYAYEDGILSLRIGGSRVQLV
jgi:hypothetical protein